MIVCEKILIEWSKEKNRKNIEFINIISYVTENIKDIKV